MLSAHLILSRFTWLWSFHCFAMLNSAQCILVKARSLDNEEGLISEMPVFSISFILIWFDRVSQRKNFNLKVVYYMPPKREKKSECIEGDQQSSHFCSRFNPPVTESATLFILYLYYVSSVDGWSRTSHPCTRNEFGVWELTIPYKEDGSSPIPHGSKVKVSVDNWLSPVICIMSKVAKIKFLSWILQQLNLVPSLE